MALRAAKCDEDASAISDNTKDLAGVFNGAVTPRPRLFTFCENALEMEMRTQKLENKIK